MIVGTHIDSMPQFLLWGPGGPRAFRTLETSFSEARRTLSSRQLILVQKQLGQARQLAEVLGNLPGPQCAPPPPQDLEGLLLGRRKKAQKSKQNPGSIFKCSTSDFEALELTFGHNKGPEASDSRNLESLA